MTRWLDNLSLRAKVLGALILVVIVGVLSLGWDANSIVGINGKTGEISDEAGQLLDAQYIQTNLLEEDIDAKNILLSGDTSYLTELNANVKDTDKYIAEVSANALSAEDQQALDDIAKMRADYEQNWGTALAAFQAGNTSEAADAAYVKSDNQIVDIGDKINKVIDRGQTKVGNLVDEASQQSQTALLVSGIGTLLFMLIGVVVFISVNRTVGAIQAVAGAAASVEAGKYDQVDLSSLLKRGDDVGQLARVFKRMSDEVYAREQKLTAQVEVLNIQIDLVKQDKQVQEIVDSGFFKDLQVRAKEVREARQKSAGKPPAVSPSEA